MQILPIPLISKKNACTVIVQKTIVSSQGKSHKWKNIYINNTISAYIDCTSIVIIGADLASSAIKHLGFCLISNAIKYFYSFRLLDLQHRPSCRDLLVFGVYQWFKEGKHIDHSLSKIKSKKKKNQCCTDLAIRKRKLYDGWTHFIHSDASFVFTSSTISNFKPSTTIPVWVKENKVSSF